MIACLSGCDFGLLQQVWYGDSSSAPCWLVGTRSSLSSPQAARVKGWLPEPSEVHEGMTFMLELIDPLLDPHGETEAAVGSAGMRVLAAWCNRRRLSMTELEDPSLLALLGEKATVVPQCTMERADFLKHFEEEVECMNK